MQWDKDSQYLLVKHSYDKKSEWIVVRTDKTSSAVNITASLKTTVSSLRFAGNSGDAFYGLIGGAVRKINLKNNTVSSPLVSDVKEFSLYSDDIISYVTTSNKTTGIHSAGIVKDGQSPVLLEFSTDPKTVFHIEASHYFHNDYVAISNGSKTTIYRGEFPSSQTERSKLKATRSFNIDGTVDWLRFSAKGRFIVAQHADTYRSLDLDRGALSPKITLAGKTKATKLQWLDSYMVWSDRSKQLMIEEFDGANRSVIGSVTPGFDVTLSPNGKYLYSIGATKKGFELQRIQMILN